MCSKNPEYHHMGQVMDNFGAASVKSSYSSYTIRNMVPKFHQFHEWQRYDTDFSFINFSLNLDDDIFSRIFELFPPHPFIRQFPCSFNNIWKEKIQNSCMWRINLSWIICKNSTHNNPFSRRKDVQNRFYSSVIFAWKSSYVFYTIWAKCIIIWGEKNISSTTVSFVQLFLVL